MFSTLTKRANVWWQQYCAILVLGGIDQRLLDDMGLDRAEIAARVRGKPRQQSGC